jgi:hypothetical protein
LNKWKKQGLLVVVTAVTLALAGCAGTDDYGSQLATDAAYSDSSYWANNYKCTAVNSTTRATYVGWSVEKEVARSTALNKCNAQSSSNSNNPNNPKDVCQMTGCTNDV